MTWQNEEKSRLHLVKVACEIVRKIGVVLHESTIGCLLTVSRFYHQFWKAFEDPFGSISVLGKIQKPTFITLVIPMPQLKLDGMCYHVHSFIANFKRFIWLKKKSILLEPNHFRTLLLWFHRYTLHGLVTKKSPSWQFYIELPAWVKNDDPTRGFRCPFE